jgi:hypothetical protein
MYLTEAQRLTGTGSFAWNVASGEIIWSDQTFRIFGCDRATKPTMEFIVLGGDIGGNPLAWRKRLCVARKVSP